MSKAKHTPGPWIVGKPKGQETPIHAKAGDPTLGCTSWEGFALVYGCDDSPEKGRKVMQANALLIADAPQLFEALDELVRAGDHMGWEMRNARAALAKARGES